MAHPPEDRLALDLDQRSSPHFTAVTEQGRKLHISLPRGTELEDRDILTGDGYSVVVIAADEELITIRPGDKAQDWATVCYQLGNLHRPLRVTGDEILTPRDAQVESFLTRLGAKFHRERRPFIGRKLGSAAGHHHAHHHADHS